MEVDHTSDFVRHFSMSVVMATKMCKAVSILPLKNPEELCSDQNIFIMVKTELKQLRNLRRINPYIGCCLNQYI